MKAAKAWMALFVSLFIGGIGTALTLGLVPDTWQPWTLLVTTIVTGIGTAAGVYKIPNTPTPTHLNRTGRSFPTDPKKFVDD